VAGTQDKWGLGTYPHDVMLGATPYAANWPLGSFSKAISSQRVPFQAASQAHTPPVPHTPFKLQSRWSEQAAAVGSMRDSATRASSSGSGATLPPRRDRMSAVVSISLVSVTVCVCVYVYSSVCRMCVCE